jgi:hypothetical protein
MPGRHRPVIHVTDRVAQLALAQFLLFDATVESLSMLGERLTGSGAPAAGRDAQRELLEPYRVRYALLRRMWSEPTRH